MSGSEFFALMNQPGPGLLQAQQQQEEKRDVSQDLDLLSKQLEEFKKKSYESLVQSLQKFLQEITSSEVSLTEKDVEALADTGLADNIADLVQTIDRLNNLVEALSKLDKANLPDNVKQELYTILLKKALKREEKRDEEEDMDSDLIRYIRKIARQVAMYRLAIDMIMEELERLQNKDKARRTSDEVIRLEEQLQQLSIRLAEIERMLREGNLNHHHPARLKSMIENIKQYVLEAKQIVEELGPLVGIYIPKKQQREEDELPDSEILRLAKIDPELAKKLIEAKERTVNMRTEIMQKVFDLAYRKVSELTDAIVQAVINRLIGGSSQSNTNPNPTMNTSSQYYYTNTQYSNNPYNPYMAQPYYYQSQPQYYSNPYNYHSNPYSHSNNHSNNIVDLVEKELKRLKGEKPNDRGLGNSKNKKTGFRLLL